MIQWQFNERSVNKDKRFVVDDETGLMVTMLSDEIEAYMTEHGVLKTRPGSQTTFQFGGVTLYFPSQEVLVDFKLRFT